MSTFSQSFIRPATSIAWHGAALGEVTQAFKYHVLENYKVTDKLISEIFEVSVDELTMTVTRVFNTEADRTEYLSDATRAEYLVARDAYNSANGIIHTLIEPLGAAG